MTEEIFAPVVALSPSAGGRAIDMVNAGRYGLQAGVFTRTSTSPSTLARRLRVGGVMINDTSSYHADAMPYGGVKDSGYGLEGPRYAVQDMTDPASSCSTSERPPGSGPDAVAVRLQLRLVASRALADALRALAGTASARSS